MKFLRTYLLVTCAFLFMGNLHTLFAQSCTGNLLTDASGYYGGFENGNQSIGASKGLTDLVYGSRHGAYQIVSEANKPWEDSEGGGYLPLLSHSGEYMMLIHTSDARLWYKPISVMPGQTYNICAWIASAKSLPLTGFEVRLRVKYGNTTSVIATSIAPQGRWAQICGSFSVPAGVNTIEFQIVDPFPNNRISNFLFLDDVCIRTAAQYSPDINTTYVGVPVDGNVSTNDVVPSGTTYGTPIAAAGNPSAAAIVINSNGTYTFTASTPGVYVYNVPVCTPQQGSPCPVSVLTVTVLQKNSVSNLPVAHTDFAETKMKTAVTLNSLANDAPGYIGGSLNQASVNVIAAPKNGTAVVNKVTGAITYTPNNNFSGNDTLHYQVCDKTSPSALCATALQIIFVKQNDAANTTSAADDFAATPINTEVSGNVKVNDSDAEADVQTVTPQTTTIAGKGTLMLSANGSFTFNPAANFVGPVSFTYTTCDNGTPQACAKSTLYILVQSFSSMTPLPVYLLSFTGKSERDVVQLRWETASESASSHFTIEHSTDGTAWQIIGSVAAAGNSSSKTEYGFSHRLPSKGVNYYRLQLVDANGSTTVSNIVSVKAGGKATVISKVYPNPVADQVQLTISTEIAAKVAVQLFDINGTLVQQIEKAVPAGDSFLLLDGLAKMPRGTYIMKAAVGDAVQSQKLFKR